MKPILIIIMFVSLVVSSVAVPFGNAADNVISGCYQKNKGNLRVLGRNEQCLGSEVTISWNEIGPQGPQGPVGPAGTQGAPGTNGTSVTFVGYFSGKDHGCLNGGAIYTAGTVQTYLCNGSDSRNAILLTQQDEVRAFDPLTGTGYQTGTAIGQVSGTTSVKSQFVAAGPPIADELPISFSNKVVVTDLDGDQIFFDNNGTGTFHLGVSGSDFQNIRGPLVGTYEVTGGTGKYQSWAVGTTYSYRAVLTMPTSSTGAFGSVYAEVR